MLMSAFCKDIFQQNFKVQKVFLWNMFLSYNSAIQWQRLVTLFITLFLLFIVTLGQSEYSLIWKAKPLTIPTGKKND